MSTVVVWNNNMVFHRHTYPGHAAMNLTDQWRRIMSDNTANYVSWIPQGDAKVGQSRAGKANRTFLDDLAFEKGYVPDHIIRITSLNVQDMQACWNEIRGKDDAHYRKYIKNCSTIVARVIRAGTTAGKTVSRHSLVWTPLKIKRLTLELGGTTMSWKDLLAEMRTQDAITADEATSLTSMRKRDEKHGSSLADSYYANGQKLTQQRFQVIMPTATGGITTIG